MAILCPCLCSPIYGMCCSLWGVISYVCCDLLSLRICCNVQRIMGYVVVCFVLHVQCRLCLCSLQRIMSRRRQIHTGRRLYQTVLKNRQIYLIQRVRRIMWLSGITISGVVRASYVSSLLLNQRVFNQPEISGKLASNFEIHVCMSVRSE